MIDSIQGIENYFIQIAFILYDDILERGDRTSEQLFPPVIESVRSDHS